jgi:hypothetical protein
MIGCNTTFLAGAITKANAIINDSVNAAKEEVYRLNQHSEHNQELTRQNIKYLNLCSHDPEAKQLLT